VIVRLASLLAATAAIVLAVACSESHRAAPPPTRVTVTYLLGLDTRGAPCPRGAVCTTIPGVTLRSGKNLPYHLARYTLRCGPAGGTYQNPAAACGALAEYLRLLHQPPKNVCHCPAIVYRNHIAGTFRGRHINVSLDACTVCNLGGDVGYYERALMPRA
jgi:hypothetical protein